MKLFSIVTLIVACAAAIKIEKAEAFNTLYCCGFFHAEWDKATETCVGIEDPCKYIAMLAKQPRSPYGQM